MIVARSGVPQSTFNTGWRPPYRAVQRAILVLTTERGWVYKRLGGTPQTDVTES